jgi:hypothetical protein
MIRVSCASLPVGIGEFAERAGNPAIREARLRTAKDAARGRSLGKVGGPGPRQIAERSR